MRIGLVLSGGAARGFSHLGVIKAFNELKIPIHVFSGTSSGAIAAVFYSAGYGPEEILKFATDLKILDLVRPAFSRFGLLKMEQLEKIYDNYLGNKTFEELHTKVIIASTDINRGTSVYFSSGPLVKPLLASSAVPVLYKPINYEGRVLIDGGLINNMPVECIMGEAEFIIGVHTNPMDHQSDISSFKGLLERTFHLAINNNVEPRMKLCHFLIEPPQLKQYSLLNIKKAQEMFDAGYDHTMYLKDNLLAAINKANN